MMQGHDRGKPPRPEPAARAESKAGLQDFRYRAFISYSHEDRSWADWLIKSLETYRVPTRLVGTTTSAGTIPRRISPVFRDREELASASHLGDTIRSALADSATLIVICSPASANSRWVNEEIRAFQQLGRGHRILCLIVDGVPNASDLPGQAYKECFAPALRRTESPLEAPRDHHTEPIAPDVRDDAGGRTAARLKLIAGLLGVGFDVLKRRDQQRRMRRMAVVTALALGVTLVTTTLAITAVIARHTADIARQAAERRQKQAEGLVNFMLGDLYDKLNEVGRLDIMQSVDDKAMAYFASLPVADVTDQSLAQRATALQKIGEVRQDQGHLNKALKAYLLALDISHRLLREEPENATRLADYGNSQTYVGFAYWYLDDLARAERYFRSANQALGRALAARPDDPDIQQQQAYVLNNLAQVLQRRNKPEQALARYKRQIVLLKQLLAHDPGKASHASDLAIAFNNVASFEFERGQLLRSIQDFFSARRMFAALAARNPRDRSTIYYLMIVNAKLANALQETGRHQAAMQYIRRAVRHGTALVRFDPTHSDWQLLLSVYSVWQARWRRETHPGSMTAYRTLEKQQKVLAGMLKASPGNISIRRSLALARLSLAHAAMDAGHDRLAVQHVHAALATLGPLPERIPSNAKTLRLACGAELLLGRLDPSHRRTHAERALELIQPIARESRNPRDLSPWVAALLETGHRKEALDVVHRLRAIGYRPPILTAMLARRHIGYAPDPEIDSKLDAILASGRAPAAGNAAVP